jgi:hypothetical protein
MYLSRVAGALDSVQSLCSSLFGLSRNRFDFPSATMTGVTLLNVIMCPGYQSVHIETVALRGTGQHTHMIVLLSLHSLRLCLATAVESDATRRQNIMKILQP